MNTEIAHPFSAPQGAVIVLHSGSGVGQATREILSRVASAGFQALAPHLSYRDAAHPAESAGRDPETWTEIIDATAALAEVEDVLADLRIEGWADDQIGVVGTGVGGGLALLTATAVPLAAAVSVSPAGVSLGEKITLFGQPVGEARLRAPWLAQYGADESLAFTQPLRALETDLAQRSDVFLEVVAIANAADEFHVAGTPSYAPEAAFEVWQRTTEWFERRLAPPPTALAAAWASRNGPNSAA